MTVSPLHIAFLTHAYPAPAHPGGGVFLAQLVEAMARAGARCTVIHPLRVDRWLSDRAAPPSDRAPVELRRPLYLSLSDKQVGPWNTFQATQFFFERAVHRALRRLPAPPDAVYGHFLYSGGAAAVRVGSRLGLPSFAAVGEGSFWTVKPLGFARAKRDFCTVTGVIAVSSLLKKRLISSLEIPAERILVAPNGVDPSRFFPRDRQLVRQKYHLPRDLFLVAFVGCFEEWKGLHWLVEAVEGLDGVGLVCVGAGSLKPKASNLLFQGVLPHELVPEMLSAADAFALPTIEEGSCNAIIEAMACGLPVITSVGEFNDDIVDDDVAVRVEPHDVAAIRRAIVLLRDNPPMRARMAQAALAKAKTLNIHDRARAILEWIRSKVSQRRTMTSEGAT